MLPRGRDASSTSLPPLLLLGVWDCLCHSPPPSRGPCHQMLWVLSVGDCGSGGLGLMGASHSRAQGPC